MKYKIIVQLEAAQDFKEAKLWYKRTKVSGLSQRFTNAVKQPSPICKNTLPLMRSGIKMYG